MKKLTYFFASLIMVALVVSCSKDQVDPSDVSLKVAGGGNVSCGAVAAQYDCDFMYTSGNLYGSSGTVGPITWSYNSSTGLVTWTSTLPVSVAVIVKGGPASKVYFEGCGVCKTASTLIMTPPLNPNNGKFYGLSHISFCYNICTSDLVVGFKSYTTGNNYVTSGTFITSYPLALGGSYPLYLGGVASEANLVGHLTITDINLDGHWEITADNYIQPSYKFIEPFLYVGPAADFSWWNYRNYNYPDPKVTIAPSATWGIVL